MKPVNIWEIREKSIIFKGPGEELHVELYDGCDHRCFYCWAAFSAKLYNKPFEPSPRINALQRLEKEVIAITDTDTKKVVIMSSTTDPYQKIDEKNQLTRHALEMLLRNGFFVIIASKGGARIERDFDLLARYKDQIIYMVSLTFSDDADSLKYEPGAAPPSERIATLRKVHAMGIKAGVSWEPVFPRNQQKLYLRIRDFSNPPFENLESRHDSDKLSSDEEIERFKLRWEMDKKQALMNQNI